MDHYPANTHMDGQELNNVRKILFVSCSRVYKISVILQAKEVHQSSPAPVGEDVIDNQISRRSGGPCSVSYYSLSHFNLVSSFSTSE